MTSAYNKVLVVFCLLFQTIGVKLFADGNETTGSYFNFDFGNSAISSTSVTAGLQINADRFLIRPDLKVPASSLLSDVTNQNINSDISNLSYPWSLETFVEYVILQPPIKLKLIVDPSWSINSYSNYQSGLTGPKTTQYLNSFGINTGFVLSPPKIGEKDVNIQAYLSYSSNWKPSSQVAQLTGSQAGQLYIQEPPTLTSQLNILLAPFAIVLFPGDPTDFAFSPAFDFSLNSTPSSQTNTSAYFPSGGLGYAIIELWGYLIVKASDSSFTRFGVSPFVSFGSDSSTTWGIRFSLRLKLSDNYLEY